MSENESFERAIERLLSDQSPRAEAPRLDDTELSMLRVAQVLRGSQESAPTPQFVERLHDELFPPARRVSRRAAFLSGVGAMAAGLLGGFGIERLAVGGTSTAARKPSIPLVSAKRGKWIHVADVADVPPGAIHPFTAGAVQGVLINSDGNLRAMSSICSHMGCALRLEHEDGERYFSCPCHGAEFNLSGQLKYGANGYFYHLPPLPTIHMRIKGSKVEVFGA
jgi:nitrite reductase/ring-hydroxylating ferredoxin subunit